jgi:hypothetical protein
VPAVEDGGRERLPPMTQPPAQIQQTAILQLISGLVTMTMMACISYLTIGTVAAICTFFLGGIGAVCGIVAFALVPIGIFEIVSGILGLTNPEKAGQVMKICSYVEIAAILFGGLSTAIAGGVSAALLNNPEVKAYLEG